MGRRIHDYTGQRFGQLLVLEIAGRTHDQKVTFRCKCDCGNECIVSGANLGKPKPQHSCGCYHHMRIDPDRTHKVCSRCHEDKPIEQFNHSRSAPDGRGTYCKPCACMLTKLNQPQAQRTAYMRQKRRSDPSFRIACNLRSRLSDVIKNAIKAGPTLELVGCSAEQLRVHIESLWQPSMSWDNYGEWRRGRPMTWHIDHIRPCASFDLTDPEQQRQCFHWSNMQPLWADKNMSKGKTYVETN